MKKLLSLGFVTMIMGSIFSGNVFAKSVSEENLTNQHVINWEEAWEEIDNLNDSIHFGSIQEESRNTLSSFTFAATGKTVFTGDSSSQIITSTGTTKGTILLTVTSATTSIRNVNTGNIWTGSKGTAIGKFTSESVQKLNIGTFTGNKKYEALTIHTATYNGVLYDAKSALSKTY